jgi:hypothetical protein
MPPKKVAPAAAKAAKSPPGKPPKFPKTTLEIPNAIKDKNGGNPGNPTKSVK